MAGLDHYPELHAYVVDKLNDDKPGSFLRHFLEACLYADFENIEIVEPALRQIMAKYPLRKAVEHDGS